MQLSRPLVVFDLETTGLDVKNDRVVEISCVKINPDGSREVKTRRINPTIPISPKFNAGILAYRSFSLSNSKKAKLADSLLVVPSLYKPCTGDSHEENGTN